MKELSKKNQTGPREAPPSGSSSVTLDPLPLRPGSHRVGSLGIQAAALQGTWGCPSKELLRVLCGSRKGWKIYHQGISSNVPSGGQEPKAPPLGLHGHLSPKPLHIVLSLSMPSCVSMFFFLMNQDEGLTKLLRLASGSPALAICLLQPPNWPGYRHVSLQPAQIPLF